VRVVVGAFVSGANTPRRCCHGFVRRHTAFVAPHAATNKRTAVCPPARRYDNGGSSAVAAPLSDGRGSGGGRQDRRVLLSAIKDEGLGMGGQAAWVQVTAQGRDCLVLVTRTTICTPGVSNVRNPG
jgi:hypothetical protein